MSSPDRPAGATTTTGITGVITAAERVAAAVRQDYPNLHPCCHDGEEHRREMYGLLAELVAAVDLLHAEGSLQVVAGSATVGLSVEESA